MGKLDVDDVSGEPKKELNLWVSDFQVLNSRTEGG